MYVTIRSRIWVIKDVIGLELSELSALFNFFYTLASANTDKSAPNLVTICMTIRSRTSSIMGPIAPEQSELFALELRKIAEFDYILASRDIN